MKEYVKPSYLNNGNDSRVPRGRQHVLAGEENGEGSRRLNSHPRGAKYQGCVSGAFAVPEL